MTKTAQARGKTPAPKAQVRLRKEEGGWTLSLYGIVGDWLDGFDAESVDAALAEVPSDEPLTVRLNSPGGAVFEGIPILNALANRKGAVRVVVDGLAASMGSHIAMAGDTVAMYPSSMLMIHNPWSISIGDAQIMRKDADMLDKIREALLSAYERKSGQDRDTLIAMMDEETWLTAEEAVEWGFADEIIEPEDQDPTAAIAKLDLSILPNIPDNVAQMVARHRIAGQARNAGAAEPAETPNDTEVNVMTDDVKKSSADNNAAVDEKQVREEAVKAERKRVAEIQRACRAAKLEPEFADELIRDGVSVEQAQARIIDRWAEQDKEPEVHNQTRVGLIADEQEKFRAHASDAILMRANVKEMDASNEMRGFGLMDYARTSLERAGVRTAGMSKEQIAKAVLSTSTSDFPNIFENAMHRMLLAAYEAVEVTWPQWCATGDLSDFRGHNRYRMGSFPRLAGLQENGELKHTALPDAEKETITGEENGLIFTLSYKMLVDDDMGAFINIAQALGQTAALSVEEDVFTLLTGNPTMSDGVDMFHADHGNLASSGAAPSVSSLGKVRSAMRKQKDPGGNSYIMLTPRILLVPEDLADTVWEIVNSTAKPGQQNSGVRNREQGRWDVISSPYLDEDSSTAWYAFATPSMAPAFEVGFVNGQRTPAVETEEAFSSRGIRYRVTHDYGVAARDYRPAYKNPGA